MADEGPLKGLILAVDLDGVCADFYGRMREVAAEWFERRVEDLTTDVSYGLREWGVRDMDQYRSLHRFAVTQRVVTKERFFEHATSAARALANLCQARGQVTP